MYIPKKEPAYGQLLKDNIEVPGISCLITMYLCVPKAQGHNR
jgi:hypothetical protein